LPSRMATSIFGTAVDERTCARCRRSLAGRMAFLLDGELRCLACTLRRPSLLKRSAGTAPVVGTILTTINQGTTLAGGELSGRLIWQIPLTYLVPFLVATWGALSNSRA
jgi:hypothetical protein